MKLDEAEEIADNLVGANSRTAGETAAVSLYNEVRLLRALLNVAQGHTLKLEGEKARLEQRIELTHVAAMRYESRHDRDPERKQLWQELKEALLFPDVENKMPPYPEILGSYEPHPSPRVCNNPECYNIGEDGGPCGKCRLALAARSAPQVRKED